MNTSVISKAVVDAVNAIKTKDERRPFIGPSSMGEACERRLWLQFRWAFEPAHTARVYRIFRQGINEEAAVIADLRSAGFQVVAPLEQVTFSSHVRGTGDGIIDLPGIGSCILEVKTHNLKSFAKLVKDGVAIAHPKHFTQMQAYMHGYERSYALYYAVCKDDNEIYTEVIAYDEAIATRAVERAILLSTECRLPGPITSDPTWYECRWCEAREFCHGEDAVTERNCRTCEHGTAFLPQQGFSCMANGNAEIPLEFQRTGCDNFALKRDLSKGE